MLIKPQAQGSDDEDDPLLNPAHLLVAACSKHRGMANEFADWMADDKGGQDVVRNFRTNGFTPYSAAPKRVDPVGKARLLLQ